jgi:hypothetical protein
MGLALMALVSALMSSTVRDPIKPFLVSRGRKYCGICGPSREVGPDSRNIAVDIFKGTKHGSRIDL